eukprot:364280-Chlamydomonas_euryale.AAC.14
MTASRSASRRNLPAPPGAALVRHKATPSRPPFHPPPCCPRVPRLRHQTRSASSCRFSLGACAGSRPQAVTLDFGSRASASVHPSAFVQRLVSAAPSFRCHGTAAAAAAAAGA